MYAVFSTMFAMTGLLLVAYYDGCDPLSAGYIEKTDQVSVPQSKILITGWTVDWMVKKLIDITLLHTDCRYVQCHFQIVPLLMVELLGFIPGFSGLFLASLFCASLR